jgi:predicted O-methyltransferase YrrM
MSQETWTAVERYLVDSVIPPDPIQEETLQANTVASLPGIDVAPNEGKLLYLLAKIRNAKRILEIGTLGGYSTIWLARALPPDGTLVTLEVDPKHATVAAANIARAGFSSVVELRLGPALDSLAKLHAEGAGLFDFIFIDADKPNNPGYLEWSMKLSRSGTVIVVDNVVRDGGIVDAKSSDPSIQGTRRLFAMIAADSRLDATALQTVGSKGYDGFALAVVR